MGSQYSKALSAVCDLDEEKLRLELFEYVQIECHQKKRQRKTDGLTERQTSSEGDKQMQTIQANSYANKHIIKTACDAFISFLSFFNFLLWFHVLL